MILFFPSRIFIKLPFKENRFMKVLSSFLFFLIIIFSCNAQDCNTLNEFNSFHGLRFGQEFPDSLKQYFSILDQTSSYIDYDLNEKKLKSQTTIFNKFYKWFYFGETFSDLSISCLRDGKIFRFELRKFPRGEDSVEVRNNKFPDSFLNISDEVTSLFGKSTK